MGRKRESIVGVLAVFVIFAMAGADQTAHANRWSSLRRALQQIYFRRFNQGDGGPSTQLVDYLSRTPADCWGLVFQAGLGRV